LDFVAGREVIKDEDRSQHANERRYGEKRTSFLFIPEFGVFNLTVELNSKKNILFRKGVHHENS